MHSGLTKEKVMTNWPTEEELAKARKEHSTGIASRPLSENATKIEILKFKLCEKFVIYKNENSITQRALAKEIGIDESLVSKITHYHFNEFTIERLLNYLDKISPEFDLKVIDIA